MSKLEQSYDPKGPGQSKPIAILFADAAISQLFHALVSARGATSRIVGSPCELTSSEKLITEPQYASALTPDIKSRCLVVGNQDSDSSGETLFIARPLTEQKIENSLSKLFDS